MLEEQGAALRGRAVTGPGSPTKEYEDFALPAGEYTALRVIVGEGGAELVVRGLPPLCLGAASETVERRPRRDTFTDDQAA